MEDVRTFLADPEVDQCWRRIKLLKEMLKAKGMKFEADTAAYYRER
jgi:hypothetical protein